MVSNKPHASPTPTPRRGHYIMSQEEIDRSSIQCDVVGGRASREHCPSCTHREDASCPLNSEASDESTCVRAVAPIAPESTATTEDNDTGELASIHEAPEVYPADDDAEDVPVSGDGDHLDEDAEAGEVLAPPDLEHESTADSDVPVTALEPVDASTDGDQDLWDAAMAELGEDARGLSVESVSPEQITTLHERANMMAHQFVVLACAIGLVLIERKKQLGHGQFKPWIADNCSFSYSTAARYMGVARTASEMSHACDFSWKDVPLRDVGRLLPSPSKKTRGNQKHTKGPASTSSPETSAPADTHDAPSLATSTHSTGEKPEVGTSSAATTGAGDAVEVEDVAADSPDATMEPKCTCDTTFDVEAAMAMILKDIEAHRKPQARAIELIERIAGSFGITVSLRGELIALLRTRPAKTSVPSSPPRRVLRYSDLMDMNGAGASKGATG